MKILVISDAWKPQVNGVVRTYECLAQEMPALGHEIRVIGPADFPWRVALPFYREIELALWPARLLARMVDDFAPDTIHIATEGPLGRAARSLCLRRGWPFTTCYHTQFPEYAAKRAAKFAPALYGPVRGFVTKILRAFHAPATTMMVATESLCAALREEGYSVPMALWARGVYIDIFHPGDGVLFADCRKPVALYVGRVAIEKNIEAFLDMKWAGDKVIVGDGPALPALKARYPAARFIGKKTGHDLADCYRSADIFVFPSRTDTFGMVLPEAMACGLPLAGYDVTGPRDIVTAEFLGCVGDDLAACARQALQTGDPAARFAHARATYAWPAVAQAFINIINSSKAVITR